MWQRIRTLLGAAGKSTLLNSVKVNAKLGVSVPMPIEQVMIQTFQNSVVGYARTIIREQLLKAREILDTPQLLPDRRAAREAVMKSFDAYENRMRFMSQNELLRLNADLNKSRQMLAGIREYVWTTCLDDRVRPRHQALEGTVQNWYVAPSPGYHPGEDYMCRCVGVPVLDDTYMLVRNQQFL